MKMGFSLVRIGLLAVALSPLGVSAAAQEKKITAKQVPTAVLTAFKTAYPKATIRRYAQEKENGKVFFEIESLDGKTKRDILYNADGTVAEMEESISASDLPADAQQAIKRQYPKALIMNAEKTTAGDKISYEITARQGRKRITMEFDASGKVLSNKIN